VDEILQHFKVCAKCQAKLTDLNDYYAMGDLVRCVDCYQKEAAANRKNFSKVDAKIIDVEEMLEQNPAGLQKRLPDGEL
jgi:hypothetical protein